MHLVAPTFTSVLVTEPGAHSPQSDDDVDPLDTVKRPAAQPMHADDELEPTDVTYRPAAHSVQADVDAVEYVPA